MFEEKIFYVKPNRNWINCTEENGRIIAKYKIKFLFFKWVMTNTYENSCQDENILREYFCKDEKPAYIERYCRNGCDRRECVGKSFKVELYPKLNIIDEDFVIYTKTFTPQKIFAFIYDNDQNKVKTIELFEDGRTIGRGNIFKMGDIGPFSVNLCVGNSEESCRELSESVNFEIEGFNCNSLFENHNNVNSDRINMVLLGYGYESSELFKQLSEKILTFDGEPILVNVRDYETDEFIEKKFRWGLFSIEPFKSNKDKFNIWYRYIDEPVEDFLKKIEVDAGYDLCGLQYPYITVLDFSKFGMVAQYPNFHDLLEINKEEIKFGISYSSYSVNDEKILHSSEKYVYYEEVEKQINDLITYTSFSLLPHETGHALFGLTDEYEAGDNPRYKYPQCARDIDEARLWWGDLVGQIDPFYFEYINKMGEFGLKLPDDISINELENRLKVDFVYGGCGTSRGSSGVIRPTGTSMWGDNPPVPIFGSVNRKRAEQLLNLFSGR